MQEAAVVREGCQDSCDTAEDEERYVSDGLRQLEQRLNGLNIASGEPYRRTGCRAATNASVKPKPRPELIPTLQDPQEGE